MYSNQNNIDKQFLSSKTTGAPSPNYNNNNFQRMPTQPFPGKPFAPENNNPNFGNMNTQFVDPPAYPHQPGYGMGPAPGYNPYAQQQPQGLVLRDHQVTMLKNLLVHYADMLFVKHDSNKSGKLDLKEILPVFGQLFALAGLPQPSPPEVVQIMQSYDNNYDGLIDQNEFRKIVLAIMGLNKM